MKSILNVVLYAWIMLIDLILYVSIYSFLNKVCLVGFESSELVAYIAAMVGVIITFTHLKTRARIREYQRNIKREYSVFSKKDKMLKDFEDSFENDSDEVK